MSVMTQRQIVDFAEDGVRLAMSGPGELADGMDALIHRLVEEGLLCELLAHEWVRGPVPPRTTFDPGSRPKKGCLQAIYQRLAWWIGIPPKETP